MVPKSGEAPRALEGLRVLDLGGEIANYSGRLFAQLGAEVLLVEPVEGARYRSSAPWAESSGESLRFAYDNSDKKSVALDLATSGGREAFSRLARTADLLIDDRSEHDIQATDLNYEALGHLYPNLVKTVITPFGLSGPYADHKATDLTCLAIGGMLWLGGYAEGAPVQAAGRQAFRAGSLFGAVASMAALLSSSDNDAELIDVAVQECVALGLENSIQYFDLENHTRRRHGGKQKQAGFGVFPCSDGYVFLIAGGIGGNRFWTNFTQWLKSEHVVDAEILEEQRWWEREFVESEEAKDEFWRIFTEYSMKRTKDDLLRAAIEWNVPLSPVKTLPEVHRSAQLRDRGFFAMTEIGGSHVEVPGLPYHFSSTPWEHGAPAPKLGQHTDEILLDAGLTAEEIADMKLKREIA